MRATNWTLSAKIKGFKPFVDIAKNRRQLSVTSSPRFLGEGLAKARYSPSWPSRPSGVVNGSMVSGMSTSFRGPPFIGATRGVRILVATPVNEGKQVDMEFADGSAYRCLALVDMCKRFVRKPLLNNRKNHNDIYNSNNKQQ